MSVDGEVVLITGGSSGIGLATARLFSELGARVILAARDPDRLAAAVTAVGGDTRGVAADFTQPEQVRTLAADVAAAEGRLDVLINSAGQFEVGPAEQAGPEIAERLMRVNYLGAVNAMHAFLPLLRSGQRRSIVNVASLAAKIAPPYMAAYAASKSALGAYTHALRQELKGEGFHIGLVSPGPVSTPMIEGRVRTTYYPLPPGVEIISPEVAARAILRAVRRRVPDMIVPGKLSAVLRVGQAFPLMVDRVYRWVK